MELAANGFPIDPTVDRLPFFESERERYEFALRVIGEQADRLGDYLFAALRQAGDNDLRSRWMTMTELMQEIKGEPITLTYRACDRIAAERVERERDGHGIRNLRNDHDA